MNFYRYEIVEYASIQEDDFTRINFPNPKVILREFNLHKETPKGYWIGYGGFGGLSSSSKWIPKVSRKRYAYPTKEEAIENFILRTKKRIEIISRDVNVCKIGLHLGENIKKSLKEND